MLQNLRKKKENSIKKSMILNKRKTQSSKQTKLKTWLKYKPFKKSQVWTLQRSLKKKTIRSI